MDFGSTIFRYTYVLDSGQVARLQKIPKAATCARMTASQEWIALSAGQVRRRDGTDDRAKYTR
jgi:hypothetical protein